MAVWDYHLRTTWRVRGSIEDVASILADTGSLPRWFPACVLEVRVLDAGGADRLDERVELLVKGWMPHTLRFNYRIAAVTWPTSFELVVSGHFTGRLLCRLSEESGWTRVGFDWRVTVERPLVRWLSWVIRPVLVSNHLWVVARGQESLQLEVERRRAGPHTDVQARPPGPTFPHGPLRAYVTSRVWSRARLVVPSTRYD